MGQYMRKLVTILMQPALIFVPFVLVGVIVWLALPGEYLRLRAKEQITLAGVLYLGVWYAVVMVAAASGRFVPVRLQSQNPDTGNRISGGFYAVVSALAFAGCASLLTNLGGINGILIAITEQQVNQLKHALYENYSSGALTLRYLTSVAAAIAVFNLLSRRRRTVVLDIVNIAMLVIVALVSARILIFQTVIFVLYLRYSTARAAVPMSAFRKAVICVVVGAILVGFTYSRSAGTYRQQLGVENPVMVTLIEFSRYIAMPVQVSVGVANIATTTRLDSLMDFQPMYLAPSFLHPPALKQDNSGGVGAQWYYSHIDVPGTLTTNSAFAAAVGSLGHMVFLGLPPVLALFSALFFMVARSNDLVLRLYGGVILYAFFELWRTYYFAAGSFVFFNLVFLGYIAAGLIKRSLVLVQRRRQGLFAEVSSRSSVAVAAVAQR